MRRVLILASIVLAAMASSLAAARPGFGNLYYDGHIVRTLVPPAAMPHRGTDNLYVVSGQLAVAAVAPGDKAYHGGKWAFHAVSWNVEPYVLTSERAVLAAEAAGDVAITRVPENDFKCPIQPPKGGGSPE